MKLRFNILGMCALLFCTVGLFAGTKLSNDNVRLGIYNIRGENPADGVNRWEFRKDSLSKLILKNKIDIVGLQEAIDFQLDDIVARTNYGFVGEKGLFDPIIYNKERFVVLDWNMFWFSESMLPHEKGWDAKYERYCTWAKFKDKKTKREFFFFNTHFDHKGLIAKTNSAVLISKEAKRIAGKSAVFVAGDLNSMVTTEAYKTMSHNFIDTRAVAPLVFGPVGTAHNFGGVHPVRIDYIFVNDKVKVSTYRVIDEAYENNCFPSDHYAVYVDVKIKK